MSSTDARAVIDGYSTVHDILEVPSKGPQFSLVSNNEWFVNILMVKIARAGWVSVAQAKIRVRIRRDFFPGEVEQELSGKRVIVY